MRSRVGRFFYRVTNTIALLLLAGGVGLFFFSRPFLDSFRVVFAFLAAVAAGLVWIIGRVLTKPPPPKQDTTG